MSVVIDEVIAEPMSPAPRQQPAQAKGTSGAKSIDIDKLDFERQRSRHRSERLWAD